MLFLEVTAQPGESAVGVGGTYYSITAEIPVSIASRTHSNLSGFVPICRGQDDILHARSTSLTGAATAECGRN